MRPILTRERIKGGARELGLFLLCAILGVVLNQGLFLLGLSQTTALHAVVLVGTIPAFTYAAGIVAGVETFAARKVAGLAIAFAGAALLFGTARPGVVRGGASEATLAGDALIAINCASYAIYLVVSKPLTRRYDPLTVVAWIFTVAAILLVPVAAPLTLGGVRWGAVSWKAWTAYAWIVIFPTGLTYWLSSWALRRANPSLVAMYVYIQPILTAALAIPLLGEWPTWPAAAAALAIFGGMTLIARARR